MKLSAQFPSFIRAPRTPTGYTFWESFGDVGSNPCWSSGPTGCQFTYTTYSGTSGVSVTTNPSGAPYAAGVNGVNFSLSSAEQYLYAALPEQIPSGATGDFYFSLYVASQSLTNSYNYVVCLAGNTNCGSILAGAMLNYGSSTFRIAGIGTAPSSFITIATGTWYWPIHVHVGSGSGNSSITVSGTTQTFTAASNAAKYLVIGIPSSVTANYTIGNIYGNFPGYSNCAFNSYPTAAQTWSGGTAGNNPAVADLTAGTIGGNGTWSVSASVTQMTYSTSAPQNAFLTVPDICGTRVSAAPTLGLAYATGTAAEYVLYSPALVSPTPQYASMGAWVSTTIPASDTHWYDFLAVYGASSGDYVMFHWNPTGSALQIVLENHAAATAVVYTASPNTTYWVSLQYNSSSGNHTGYVYNTSGTLLGSATLASVGSVRPGYFKIGSLGSEPQGSGYYYYFGNVCMDYTSGTFCLRP